MRLGRLLTLEGNTLLASMGLTNSGSGGNNINNNSGSATVAAAAAFPTATFGAVYSQPTPGVSTPVGTVQTELADPATGRYAVAFSHCGGQHANLGRWRKHRDLRVYRQRQRRHVDL